MNVWQCEHADCKRVCYGTGGAVGLTAIGWYFRMRPGPVLLGPLLLCPAHHPDGPDLADTQAELVQALITGTVAV